MTSKRWKSSQEDFVRRRLRRRRLHVIVPSLAGTLLLFLLFHHHEGLSLLLPDKPLVPGDAGLTETARPLPAKETGAPSEASLDLLGALSERVNDNSPVLMVGDRPLTIDVELQALVQSIFRNFNPLYASAVVLDAHDSTVLAMVSHSKQPKDFLALRPAFPAASVFKLVTSAAAIEFAGATAGTSLHTIGNPYRLNPDKLSVRGLRHSRLTTLEEALAKSNNVAFAYLTQRYLSRQKVVDSAYTFGFDRQIPFDLPTQESQTFLPTEGYELARASTGLGGNTLSPLHAALMAAAIANEGRALVPAVVRDSDRFENRPVFIQLSSITAHSLERMMKHTITEGTARKSFRGWKEHPILKDAYIGGKTGSLDSQALKGHCEWFVGFGRRGKQEIAVAVAMISPAHWHIKPAYVARKVFEEGLRNRTVVASHP